MFGNVVDGVPGSVFERELEQVKTEQNVANDTELTAAALDVVIERYLAAYEAATGSDFPSDPWIQLDRSISAVFGSWNNARAVTYRRLNQIPDDLGTAVNVQAMVFGNLGDQCGTGVGFTRDPSTGEKQFYGEFLPNAQGEDVVAGIRTPIPVRADRALALDLGGQSMEETFPAVYAELLEISRTLETHYTDVQDLEFTIEHNKLFLLQTRTAKRSARAWLTTQTDLVDEGLISRETAVRRVPADALNQLLAPTLNPAEVQQALSDGRRVAIGLNAGPGAARGRIAFSGDSAAERGQKGEHVILVTDETTPEDIHGMHAAQGILTARGGMTSHAAVVARGMGKPCVVGCSALRVNSEDKTLKVNGTVFGPDDIITIDGSTGEVFQGAIPIRDSEILQVYIEKTQPMEDSEICHAFDRLMAWADSIRRMRVRTNADTPQDSAIAIALGAEGIGLCRTEHMFFEADRIRAMRKMILARNPEERANALSEVEPMQTEDFRGIFRTMAGKPVTIRTLDPPLHEFLPHNATEVADLARELGQSVESVQARVNELYESNPMLGHRGCRLGIHYPQITRMQARAILRAALDVTNEGVEVHPEIMVPLVGNVRELTEQKRIILEEAELLFEQCGQTIPFLVGTMIEVPRAALTANRIAKEAQFFSFGTNDLTQMTLGVSRDDSGSFLPDYVQKGIYPGDPFVSLDIEGVGQLVRLAVERGREVRPDLKIGICGEHGGDPATILFCNEVGLDYVSCSPYRVPTARLAAAQASLIQTTEK